MLSVLFFYRFDALGRPFVRPGHVLRVLDAALIVDALNCLGRVEKENAAVKDRWVPKVAEARRVHFRGVLLVARENSVI